MSSKTKLSITILEKFASQFMIDKPEYNSVQSKKMHYITTIFFKGEYKDSSECSTKNKSKEDAANGMINLLLANAKFIFLSKLKHIAYLHYKSNMFYIIKLRSTQFDVNYQKDVLHDFHDFATSKTIACYSLAIKDLKETFFPDINGENINKLMKYAFDEIHTNAEIELDNIYNIQLNVKSKYY